MKDSPEDTRPVEDFKVLELGRKKDDKLKKMEQETEAKIRKIIQQSIQHYFHEFANPDDDISTYYFRDHPDSLHSEMADGINQWDDVREDLSHSRAAERLVKNLIFKNMIHQIIFFHLIYGKICMKMRGWSDFRPHLIQPTHASEPTFKSD